MTALGVMYRSWPRLQPSQDLWQHPPLPSLTYPGKKALREHNNVPYSLLSILKITSLERNLQKSGQNDELVHIANKTIVDTETLSRLKGLLQELGDGRLNLNSHVLGLKQLGLNKIRWTNNRREAYLGNSIFDISTHCIWKPWRYQSWSYAWQLEVTCWYCEPVTSERNKSCTHQLSGTKNLWQLTIFHLCWLLLRRSLCILVDKRNKTRLQIRILNRVRCQYGLRLWSYNDNGLNLAKSQMKMSVHFKHILSICTRVQRVFYGLAELDTYTEAHGLISLSSLAKRIQISTKCMSLSDENNLNTIISDKVISFQSSASWAIYYPLSIYHWRMIRLCSLNWEVFSSWSASTCSIVVLEDFGNARFASFAL